MPRISVVLKYQKFLWPINQTMRVFIVMETILDERIHLCEGLCHTLFATSASVYKRNAL